jgi:drug/metabolite transporter (DMT)-like permease
VPAQTSYPDRGLAPHLALIAVQILFGTWPILGKVVLKYMSTTSLIACRLIGATIVFVAIQRNLRAVLRMPRRDLTLLVLSSLTGVLGNQLLYVKGLSLSTVINATLISTTIPVFALFISLLFGYDRLSLRRALGIVLAASGVIYLVNPLRADVSSQTTIGNVLMITSSFLYGAYIVISKDLFERYGALNVITWIFLVASILAAPIGAYSLSGEHLQGIGLGIWLAVGFIILLPTVGAYYLNGWALTKVTPSVVAVYIYLQPLIAFGLAPLLLGESWSWRTAVASLLIFTGVAIVTKRGRSFAVREISEHPDALSH